MQEPVNTGRALGAAFPLGSSPGRKPDLVCFSQKLDVPPKKAQWSFSEKTMCAAGAIVTGAGERAERRNLLRQDWGPVLPVDTGFTAWPSRSFNLVP